jgi:hypothetical protein
MKFVLVNGRTPRPQSFCNLCCEPIGETYLREIATRLCYCGHKCYLDRCKLCAPSSEVRERLLTSLRLYSEARQAGKTPAWRSLPDTNPVIDDDPAPAQMAGRSDLEFQRECRSALYQGSATDEHH